MEPPSHTATGGLDPFVGIAIALGLVAANGFFVSAEFALVKARADRLEELARRRRFARLATRLLERLDHSLSVAQLGITLASLALGWVGEPAVAALIRSPLATLGLGESFVTPIAVVLAFSGITAMHIVAGEQVPKLVAIAEPERIVLLVAPGMRLFGLLVAPAVDLLAAISGRVTRLLGVRDIGEGEAARSDRELRTLLAASGEAGALDEVEQELAERSVGLGALDLGDIMVPRVAIVAIGRDEGIEEARRIALEEGHDWLPVYGEDLDDIVGVIEWRALFAPNGSEWGARIGEPLFLPDSMAASDALERFVAEGARLAVVLDEHGGVAGLVTKATLYEVLTGHTPDLGSAPLPVEGSLAVHLLEEMLGRDLPDEAATVGGLITAILGRFARVGDEVEIPGARLRVLELAEHGLIARAEVTRVSAD